MPKSPFDKQFGRQGIKNPSVTPSTYPRDLGATLWLNGQYKKGTVSERARDISGYGNHGTIYSGRAMQFDGVADRIDISSVVGPFSKFTAAAWFQTDSALLMNIWSSSVVDAGNYVGTQSGKIAWFNGVAWMVSPATYNDGLPHRVAYIFDEGVYRIAVDGEIVHEEDSGTYTDGRFQYIGRLSGGGGSRFWLGELADCQIWSEAWDADDVLYDYQNPEKLASDRTGTALTTSDLAGWWPMVDGLNDADWDLVLDASGNGNHGTNVSAGAAHLTGLGAGWPQMVYRGWSRRSVSLQLGPQAVDMPQPWTGSHTIVIRGILKYVGPVWCWLFDNRHAGGADYAAVAGQDGALGYGTQSTMFINGQSIPGKFFPNGEVAELVLCVDLSAASNIRFINAQWASVHSWSGVQLEIAIFSGTWDIDDAIESYDSGTFLDLTTHSNAAALVGHWRNTGRSQWDDLTGNGNHGVESGTFGRAYLPLAPGSTVDDGLGFPLTNPRDVEAFNFDGDSYIAIADLTHDLIASGQSSTVLLFCRIDTIAPGQNKVMFEQSTDVSNRLVLWFNDGQNKWEFYPNSETHDVAATADTIVCIAGTVDGSESRMFLNASEVGSAQSYTPTDTSGNLRIGGSPLFNQKFPGLIGDIAVILTDLTADQVADLYNALKGKYGL